MGAPFTVRVAAAEDADSLSVVGASIFREAFGAQNTAEDMASYLAEAFSPARQAADIADPAGLILVAEEGETAGRTLIGYAHLIAGHTPVAVTGPDPIELNRLYVALPWHGRGVAQALMTAAIDAARGGGAKTLWLGVWEHNPRAIAFYLKSGFRRVGEHAFMLGSDRQTDWLYERPIGR